MLPFDSFVDEVGEYLVLSHIAIDEPSAFGGVPPKPWICPVQVLKGSRQKPLTGDFGQRPPRSLFRCTCFPGVDFSLPAPDVRVPLCLLNTQRRSLFRDDRWAFSAFSECRTEPARNLLKPKGET